MNQSTTGRIVATNIYGVSTSVLPSSNIRAYGSNVTPPPNLTGTPYFDYSSVGTAATPTTVTTQPNTTNAVLVAVKKVTWLKWSVIAGAVFGGIGLYWRYDDRKKKVNRG